VRISKALLALAVAASVTIPDGSWLIGYAGKPTDAAVADRRFAPVLRNRVPTYEPSSDRDRDRLTIGSNGLSVNELPPAAMASIVAWLAANHLDPDAVEFIGPSNVTRTVDPEPFRPHPR
jgi:hypothetical protein